MTFPSKIFFSIIIPTFNSEKVLRECLNSIVEQTFNNYEIILIDGLSTDSTVDIIKEYSLNNPNIHWVSEKDLGIYDAMNKGIKIANGEWVYFLGSDDKLSSNNALQEIFNFEKRAFEVVYGNAKIIGDTSWSKDGDIYDGEFDLGKLLGKNICHQAIFYKLNFIKNQIGFYNTDYKICSDWDFNFRCWAIQPFLYMNITIVNFYGGGATTSTNIDAMFSKEKDKNLMNYFGKKKLNTFLPGLKNNSDPFKLRGLKRFLPKY